jgi:hypothetical protein
MLANFFDFFECFVEIFYLLFKPPLIFFEMFDLFFFVGEVSEEVHMEFAMHVR